MSHTRSVIADPVAEGTTPLLSATFTSDGVTPVTVSAAALTLYDYRSSTIINARSAVDLLPFISAGVLTFWLDPEDTVIVHANSHEETHIARIDFEWNGGTRKGVHEIEHKVHNLAAPV